MDVSFGDERPMTNDERTGYSGLQVFRYWVFSVSLRVLRGSNLLPVFPVVLPCFSLLFWSLVVRRWSFVLFLHGASQSARSPERAEQTEGDHVERVGENVAVEVGARHGGET